MRKAIWITGVLAITAGLVMAGGRPCFAIDTPETGYKITSTDRTIDVFGSCKQVRASRSLFAPTRSSNEWNDFLGWANSNPNTLTLSACATCSDGVQNQDETGIDCGGSCPACASCSDGVQNQGETGVDCGGPCPACSGSGDSDSGCGSGCNDAITPEFQNACGTAEGYDGCGNYCSFSYDNCNAGLECCGSGCCLISVVATPPAPEPNPPPAGDEPPVLPPSPTDQPPADEPPADEPPADEPPAGDEPDVQLP